MINVRYTRFYSWNLKGRDNFGRYRCRSVDNIKLDLKKEVENVRAF
jgi:hypothetical protein